MGNLKSLVNLRYHVPIVIKWVKYLVISGRIEAAAVLRVHIRILFPITTQSRAHQTDADVFICREQKRERPSAVIEVSQRHVVLPVTEVGLMPITAHKPALPSPVVSVLPSAVVPNLMVIPLASALPVMATIILCVWAAYTSPR